MAKWLDKYEQGGLVLKQKTDNYGKKPNPNDVTVSSGPNYVGMGNDITGRDYSPAWGGQFQSGGFLQPISYKLPSRYRIPYAEPSTELATSIGGVNGEPAYLIPTFKGGKDLKDPVDEYRKTGEHLGGPFKTWQEAEKWEQEIRHPYVEKGKPIPTPLKRWGDMEDGGYVAQKGKSIPVPTTADSARLFNAQTALNNFYAKEMKAGRIRRKSVDNTLPGDPNISSSGLKGLNKDNLDFYRAQIKTRNERKGGIDDRYYERYFKFSPEQVRDLENKGLGQTKGSSEYQQYYRDMVTPMQNLAAPFALIDSRIAPQREIRYEPTTFDYPGGDVMVYDYDPLAIKPYHMRTDKEKIEWEKKYGKGTPITGSIKKPITSTGKSKIEPEKKKTSVIKKSEETKTKETKLTKPTKTEETKPAPYTPTGSKKYIVNGMEVSEEDFLGSGNTTGGSKRIIYNTPKLGTQKVLRLDGTPETDPDKIRKAMRAQEKDSDMAMGGSLPGAVGFTYARVAGSAPANGKYTKKTKASAQNGISTTDSKIKEGKNFLEQMANSPLFPERYATMTGKSLESINKLEIDNYRNKLLNNLKTVNIGKPNEYPGDKEDGNFSMTAGEYWANPYNSTQKPHTLYVREGISHQPIVTHELSHSTNVIGDLLANSPKFEYDPTLAGDEEEMYKSNKGYYTNPTEVKARRDGIGQYMMMKGLWNPITEKFTSEHYDKLKSIEQNLLNKLKNNEQLDPEELDVIPQFQNLSKPYKKDETIRIFNSFVKNNSKLDKNANKAQNGKEMKFYQEGLDFKPNSIAQDGEAIVDPMGQWAHPGEVTIIPGTDITMEGVDYPVLGISDTGDTQMMYPGEDYDFDGDYVTEYPMMKSGGWLSKYQSGGPLSRSNLEMMSTLQKDIKKQKDKKGRELLVEAANAAKNKRETVKQDNRTSREKEVAQQEVLKLKMNEARGSSPFTQTLSSFTPTGSNQAAGQIAAENIGQMTPMMGATRLFTTAMDPKNNPYGISKNNGWLDNTFGILGLVGDYLDVGAVTTPAIASGLKRFTNKPSSKVNQLDNSGRIAVETVDPETGESKFIYQLDDSPIANNYVYKPKPAKASDFTSFSTKIGDKIESISNKILNVLNNTSNYKRPLGSLEAYKNWAKLIHPELQYVDPKIIKQIHKEGIKTLNKTSGLSKVENPSRHLGLYIRDRLADKIPSFADPVVTHPTSGKFINYGPEQLHPNVLSKEELPIFEQIYAGDEDSKLWSHLRDLNKIPVRDWGYDIGKLTAQENNLVNAYAHGYDEIMNARNTGEISFNTSKFYQDKAEALNQAIQKNKFPEATSVRRGTRDYTVELLDPVTFKPTGKTVLKSELGAGDVFKDEAFLSTSIDLNSSIGNPIASEIVEIPGGGKQSYAYPNAVSSSPFPNEMEAVLPRGLVRRVEEVRPSTVDEFSNVKFPNNAKFRTKILNPYNLLLPLGGATLFGKEEKENGGWLTKYK